MAWYEGTYSCGHEGKTNIVGPTKDRQWKADRHFEGLCPECYEKARQERIEKENADAKEKSAEMELPELTGTEKQVAWANTLRLKAIEECKKLIEYADENAELMKKRFETPEKYNQWLIGFAEEKEKRISAIDYALEIHKDARFWIDNREDYVKLFDFLTNEYREYAKEQEIPEDIKKELAEERDALTVAPDCENKESGVAEIVYNVEHNEISAKYVKNDRFIKIVKELGYEWSGVWKKKMSEYTGNIDDRAAELGNKLLNAGFTVKFPNAEVKEKAINGSFEQECHRWIKYCSASKKLLIDWKGRNDTLYKAAINLPSAKYSSGQIEVAVEFYKEIQDFAETLGFQFSQKAQKAISEYKEKEKSFDVANAAIVGIKTIDDKARIRKALKSDGTILEDLADDS